MQRKEINQPAQFRVGFIYYTMDKEKRIAKLIKEIKEKRMTVNVKSVVISSILSKGPAIDIADKELIQSIINKTK